MPEHEDPDVALPLMDAVLCTAFARPRRMACTRPSPRAGLAPAASVSGSGGSYGPATNRGPSEQWHGRCLACGMDDSPEARTTTLRGIGLRLTALCGVLAISFGLLLTIVRPWYKSWGAHPDEIGAALPLEHAGPNRPHETRAIDIDAPAERVFAWVAQLGQDRAGFYSYELLEDLVGCKMPDLRYLDAALQQWKVGDRLWMYPPSKIDGLGHATLVHYEPGHALVFAT